MLNTKHNVSPIELARKKYALTNVGAEYFATIYLRIYLDNKWTSESDVFDKACKQFEETPDKSELCEDAESIEGA